MIKVVITTKYDVELSEWELIVAGTELEFIGEQNGFVTVRYKDNDYYLHNGYFVEVPEMVC